MEPTRFEKAVIKASREVILEVLSECQGNRTLAAKELGFDRKTLYNKMKLCDIKISVTTVKKVEEIR